MIKVLFVCHGNICRSVMAEFIFKNMIQERGLADKFYVESSATSSEEIGNDIYPPAKRKLVEKGIPVYKHRARQITKQDLDKFDYILVMENYNLVNMKRVVGDSSKAKRLLDYSPNPKDIADPWYTGNFEPTYVEIVEGIEDFLKTVL